MDAFSWFIIIVTITILILGTVIYVWFVGDKGSTYTPPSYDSPHDMVFNPVKRELERMNQKERHD